MKIPQDLTMNVTVKFEPRDIWIGAYWDLSKSVESPYRRLKIYICIVPLFPIIFDLEWGWDVPAGFWSQTSEGNTIHVLGDPNMDQATLDALGKAADLAIRQYGGGK